MGHGITTCIETLGLLLIQAILVAASCALVVLSQHVLPEQFNQERLAAHPSCCVGVQVKLLRGSERCDVSPLPIFDENGFKSYNGITYASAIEGWWKFIDSVGEDTSFLDAQRDQDNGDIFYLLSDTEDTIYIPKSVKYIFANVGRARIWGAEWVDDPDFIPEIDETSFLNYILGFTYETAPRNVTVLGASVLGSIEIPMFNKLNNDCLIDGCEVRRCRDYLAASEIFQFTDLNFWGDSPNEYVRGHGYYLLIATKDLADGIHTIESVGNTKKFNYPFPTSGDREWADYYSFCIGNRSKCRTGGKGKGRNLDRVVEDKQADVRHLQSEHVHMVGMDFA